MGAIFCFISVHLPINHAVFQCLQLLAQGVFQCGFCNFLPDSICKAQKLNGTQGRHCHQCHNSEGIGEERAHMTVEDLLEKFSVSAGKNLDNDRILTAMD